MIPFLRSNFSNGIVDVGLDENTQVHGRRDSKRGPFGSFHRHRRLRLCTQQRAWSPAIDMFRRNRSLNHQACGGARDSAKAPYSRRVRFHHNPMCSQESFIPYSRPLANCEELLVMRISEFRQILGQGHKRMPSLEACSSFGTAGSPESPADCRRNRDRYDFPQD